MLGMILYYHVRLDNDMILYYHVRLDNEVRL